MDASSVQACAQMAAKHSPGNISVPISSVSHDQHSPRNSASSVTGGVSRSQAPVNDDITGFSPVITGVDTRPVVTPVSPKPVAQSALAQVGAMMFNQATTVHCGLVLRLRSETYFCEIIKKLVSCVFKSVHPEQKSAQNYARAKHVDIKI